jgi:hypothetical protein
MCYQNTKRSGNKDWVAARLFPRYPINGLSLGSRRCSGAPAIAASEADEDVTERTEPTPACD